MVGNVAGRLATTADQSVAVTLMFSANLFGSPVCTLAASFGGCNGFFQKDVLAVGVSILGNCRVMPNAGAV